MNINNLSGLRKSLFWDVNFKAIDEKKSAPFIIGRVLESGNLEEWKLIKKIYRMKKITDVARSHVFTDPRSANFWAFVLSIPLNQMKCARKPSLKTPNAFLIR